MTRISTRVLFTTVPALLVAGLLSAQNGERLATVMAENAKRLHQFTYKQRTEVLYKGEDKLVRISEIHFGPDGKRQPTLISQTGGGFRCCLSSTSRRGLFTVRSQSCSSS